MHTIQTSPASAHDDLKAGVVLPRTPPAHMMDVLRELDATAPDQAWWERLISASADARLPMDLKHAKAPVGGWAWAPRTLTSSMTQAWIESMGKQPDVEGAYAALLDAALPQAEDVTADSDTIEKALDLVSA